MLASDVVVVVTNPPILHAKIIVVDENKIITIKTIFLQFIVYLPSSLPLQIPLYVLCTIKSLLIIKQYNISE